MKACGFSTHSIEVSDVGKDNIILAPAGTEKIEVCENTTLKGKEGCRVVANLYHIDASPKHPDRLSL